MALFVKVPVLTNDADPENVPEPENVAVAAGAAAAAAARFSSSRMSVKDIGGGDEGGGTVALISDSGGGGAGKSGKSFNDSPIPIPTVPERLTVATLLGAGAGSKSENVNSVGFFDS